MREIVRLESKIREAAEQLDLVVPSDEFQSREDIEGAFRQGSKKRLFRYTWPIETGGSVFTTTGWRYFFDLTIRMLTENTLTDVRALLILSDASLLDSPNVKRLLTFYSATKGVKEKVVLKSDFEAIAERNEVPKDWVDFGIYDESLLYITEQSNGRFTKDKYRIELYVRLFNIIWDSTGLLIDRSEEMKSKDRLSLARLLELDAINNDSQN